MEQILSTWDTPYDLVIELMSIPGSQESRTHNAWEDTISHPEYPDKAVLPTSFGLRLIDANGKDVAFPLTLIADTHYVNAEDTKHLV